LQTHRSPLVALVTMIPTSLASLCSKPPRTGGSVSGAATQRTGRYTASLTLGVATRRSGVATSGCGRDLPDMVSRGAAARWPLRDARFQRGGIWCSREQRPGGLSTAPSPLRPPGVPSRPPNAGSGRPPDAWWRPTAQPPPPRPSLPCFSGWLWPAGSLRVHVL
jgi:hypothetical protein